MRQMKKRYFTTIAAAISLAAANGVTLGAVPTIKDGAQQQSDKLKKLQDTIAKTQAERDKIWQQVDASRAEMQSINAVLIVRARIIQEKEDEMSLLEEEITGLQEVEHNQTLVLDQKKSKMAETLAALSRLSERPPALGLARPTEAINTARSAGLMTTTLPELKRQAAIIRDDIEAVRETRAELDEKKDALSSTLASTVEDKRVLDEFLARRESKYKELRQRAEKLDKELQEMARNAASLKALLAKLEMNMERLELAADDARQRIYERHQESQQAEKDAPEKGRPDMMQGLSGKKFAEVKGRMPPPVRGELVQKYGQKTDVEQSRGIRIQTRLGAQVVAPHDGTVVFSGPFRHYGHILILSHGNNYYTLYAGLEKQDAFVGQWLLAGEPLGQMPTKVSGKKDLPELYMELRKGGDPIDPTPWIRFSKRKVTGP